MAHFPHTDDHPLDCDCTYCMGVDPNNSIARELERYVEELTTYSLEKLTESQQEDVYRITQKILLLRRYFPTMELPPKHSRILKSL